MKYLILAFSILGATTAYAAKTGNGTIETLMSAYGGWIFNIDHSNNNPNSCSKPTMILRPDHGQYKQIYSLILTAYTANKPITIFTDACDANGYNIVSNIYTAWGK